jgi:hypothetical protein
LDVPFELIQIILECIELYFPDFSQVSLEGINNLLGRVLQEFPISAVKARRKEKVEQGIASQGSKPFCAEKGVNTG